MAAKGSRSAGCQRRRRSLGVRISATISRRNPGGIPLGCDRVPAWSSLSRTHDKRRSAPPFQWSLLARARRVTLFLRDPSAVEVGNQPRVFQQQSRDRCGRYFPRCVPSLGHGLRPHERKLDVVIRSGCVLEQSECRAQHVSLAVGVVGPAERPAHRIADTCEPRHSDPPRQVRHPRQRDGRNPARFEDPLHQSYGPGAEGSDGDEHRRVHAFVVHPGGDGGRGHLDQLGRIEDVSHGRVVGRRRAPDGPLLRELRETPHG